MNETGTLSSKAADVLLDNLREALKAVDISTLLAYTAVAFLLLHGIQGDYVRELKPPVAASPAAAPPSTAPETAGRPGVEDTIPILGFRAELLSGSLFAVILYWVVCLRAASRVKRARRIAEELKSADSELLRVALLYPSLATSSGSGKIASCSALGVLGFAAWASIYGPLRPLTEWVASSSFMLLPAGYLGWQLYEARILEAG